jgi:hypothetical protein
MNPIVCNFAALTVALLYCSWQRHRHLIDQKQRVLRRRVAFMLWVMAQPPDEHNPLCVFAERDLTVAES